MDTTEQLHFHFSLSCIGEGNGTPLQCSCLENPRDGGAWWAAVYGVAQSRTRLKRLSSSIQDLKRIKTDELPLCQNHIDLCVYIKLITYEPIFLKDIIVCVCLRTHARMCVIVTQLYPTLCHPMDCSPPGSSVHGILQARILEWIVIPFSRGSSQSKDQTLVSCIAGRLFTV